jgi:DNA-binding MarR family transcriptional regulator
MQNDPPESVAHLTQRLIALMGVLHSRVAGDALSLMVESQLTLPQMVCLHVLLARGAQSVNQVADALSLSASAASHLIDRLVERELVLRIEGKDDRRQKQISITPAGAELIAKLGAARAAQIEAAVATLDADLRERLVGVVEQVIQQLSTEGSVQCPQS